MARLCVSLALVALFFSAEFAGQSAAQQTTIGAPAVTINEGFHERIGTNWGLRGKGWFANFGGANLATPQFGGYTPGAGANFGFGFGGGGVQGNFFGSASQGNTRSMTSTTPSVTTMNGYPGTISDTSQSPFVIGFIPVVGGFPSVGVLNPVPAQALAPSRSTTIAQDYLEAMRRARAKREQMAADNFQRMPAPVAAPPGLPQQPQAPKRAARDAGPADLELIGGGAVAADPAARQLAVAQSSSAGRPAMSVAEARQAHAAQQQTEKREALVWMERAIGAERAGKANVAAIYYRMAAQRAGGELRQQAIERMTALQSDAEPR